MEAERHELWKGLALRPVRCSLVAPLGSLTKSEVAPQASPPPPDVSFWTHVPHPSHAKSGSVHIVSHFAGFRERIVGRSAVCIKRFPCQYRNHTIKLMVRSRGQSCTHPRRCDENYGNSFYRSVLGNYGSSEPSVIRKQLLMMKVAGLDGVWIDIQTAEWLDTVRAIVEQAPWRAAGCAVARPTVLCGDAFIGS